MVDLDGGVDGHGRRADGSDMGGIPVWSTAYPGTLRLSEATGHRSPHLLRMREETGFVGPGPLTLLYPQWVPGGHSRARPRSTSAGLVIRANGRPIAWKRDPVQVYAIVPDGVHASVEFDFAAGPGAGPCRHDAEMLNLQWNTVAPVSGSATIPAASPWCRA